MGVRQCHALHRMVAQELVQNHEHIASEELWYEESDPQDLTVRRDQGMSLFQVDHLRQICPADLRNDEDTNDDSDVLQTIHERFAQENRAQRLHKRRQRRRRSSQINSDSVMQRSAKRSPSMMSDESQDEVRGTGRRQPHTSPASKQAASPVFSSGSEQPTPSTTKPAIPRSCLQEFDHPTRPAVDRGKTIPSPLNHSRLPRLPTP